MAHKKGHKGVAPKGTQSEADRLAAIARAYGKDADGKDITSTGGAVTGGGYISPSEARQRALDAASARAKAQASSITAQQKSEKKFGPDTSETAGGGGSSGALTEAQRLANELARLKIQAERDKADREAQKVLDDREASAQEKADAVAERQRKFAAYSKVADIYAGQGAQTDALYGGQLENLPKQQQGDLDALLKAVSAGQGQISGAENQFLSSLVTPTAYSDVPLVDLSTTQPVNPLMGALGAEGADTAGVTGQSAMDAALAAQFAQLSRNTASQLNTGSQNYMNALRNAGVGAAAAGRQELATGQTAYQNQINAKYSDLANQLAMQRLQAQQEADIRAAQARAEAAAYGEAPAAAQPPATAQPPVTAQPPAVTDPLQPPVTEQPPVDPNAAAVAAEAERKRREREAAIAAVQAARRNQF
jgi:hypothetical protein